jgi:YesN/AraC family two-component response regulator
MADQDLAALSPDESMSKLNDYYYPPYITQAHIFNAPQGWGFTDRVLKQYALQYVFDGSAEFWVENRKFSTHKGDLILYRPYETHSVRMYPNEDYISITIVFHYGNSTFPNEEMFAWENYLGNYANHEVNHYISELVGKYHQPGVHNQMQCQGLLHLILSACSKSRRERQMPGASKRNNTARLVHVKNHILKHLDKNIVPEELERLSGLSWNYLTSQFTKTFGYTVVQFLISSRIEAAKKMALESSLSYGEIANRVGYNSVHSFGKIFRKKTSMSLSEFCASVYDFDHWKQRNRASGDGGNDRTRTK